MKQVEFTAKQVVGEFWIGFTDKDNIETGIIIKKLSDGNFLIPSGMKKKIFMLEDLENIKVSGNDLVQLPFVIGITDFHSTDAMKPETFASFMKTFKQAFCLPEPSSHK